MKGQLEREGNYEIFETTKGTQILVLNKENFYAIVEGYQGHILVKTDADHQKKKTLQKGAFYLADFRNNPEFNDIPHLFLQDGKKYKEFILPKDLPTNKNKRKKVVITKVRVSEKKIKDQVKNAGSEKSKGSSKNSKETAQKTAHRGTASRDTSKKTTSKSSAKNQTKKTTQNRGPVKKSDLTSKTKSELYEMAKKKNISNRSKMSKEELIKNLK